MQFKECKNCSKKPGSPQLCEKCLIKREKFYNREKTPKRYCIACAVVLTDMLESYAISPHMIYGYGEAKSVQRDFKKQGVKSKIIKVVVIELKK